MLLHERTRKRAIRLALVLGVWGPTLLVAAVCWRSSQPAALRSAVAQVEAIGGTLKKLPSIYPRPGSFPGKPPVIDWAVMADPFGNEFCLVQHS